MGIGVSKDLNEKFKRHLGNSGEPLDIDFSIQVLSSGSWPFQQSCVFSLPTELERCVSRFTAFYSGQHSGRKLNWLYHISKGELVTNCFKNKYTLQASTFQMSALLAFMKLTVGWSRLWRRPPRSRWTSWSRSCRSCSSPSCWWEETMRRLTRITLILRTQSACSTVTRTRN